MSALIASVAMLFACSPELPLVESQQSLHVLTYSSFLGKGSYGEWLKQSLESENPKIKVLYIEAQDESGMSGELRRRSKGTARIDMVIGLDAIAIDRIGKEKFSKIERISSSPMAILINKTRAPKALIDRNFNFATWQEALDSGLLNQSLVVQDPRFSSPGLSWLLQMHAMDKVSAREANRMVRRVFPSWSAALSAFEKSEGIGVWTYSSSLSYFECHAKPHDLVYLNVEEGYVSSEELAAVVVDAPHSKNAQIMLDWMLSPAAQKKMVELNWVYPISEVPLPECYVPKKSFKQLAKPAQKSAKVTNQWIDEWQLF